MKDRNRKLLVDEERIRARWVEYFSENVENEREELPKEQPVAEPEKEPTRKKEEEAIKAMKMGNAAGPSGITAEFWKHLGQAGIEWLLEMLKDIWAEGRVPEQWKRSEIVTIYKEKGGPLECGNYRVIKYLEHGVKIVEKILEKRLRKIINIDQMQFGFSEGKGTTDAISIVRQVQKKMLEKDRKIYMAFLDQNKALRSGVLVLATTRNPRGTTEDGQSNI